MKKLISLYFHEFFDKVNYTNYNENDVTVETNYSISHFHRILIGVIFGICIAIGFDLMVNKLNISSLIISPLSLGFFEFLHTFILSIKYHKNGLSDSF